MENDMLWIQKHPRATIEMLGFIPEFLSEDDPRPAREQINDKYGHGGGWRPLPGFRMTENALHYPEDPPYALLFETTLHDEVIRFYNYAWVAIISADGSFEVCRMD
jgi:hypothetical protein